MDAEAPVARASRIEGFLAAVLRNTRLSIAGLAMAVAGDTLVPWLGRAAVGAVFAGVVASAVGVLVPYRPERLGCVVGLVVFAIRIWSALVALFLAVGLVMIP